MKRIAVLVRALSLSSLAVVTGGCEIATYVDRSELDTSDASDSGGKSDAATDAAQCGSPSDCPAPQQECMQATCSAARCGTGPAPYQQPCSSGQCDGLGKCLPPTCIDHIKDGLETDVDCGGSLCPPCADYMNCAQNSDCASSICDSLSHTCGA